jgi:hypothetical protein
MNHLRYLHSRGWILFVVTIAFVAGHLFLFHILRPSGASHVALPSAVVAGLLILVVAKHLGLLAALFRYAKALLQRGSKD